MSDLVRTDVMGLSKGISMAIFMRGGVARTARKSVKADCLDGMSVSEGRIEMENDMLTGLESDEQLAERDWEGLVDSYKSIYILGVISCEKNNGWQLTSCPWRTRS